MHTERSTHTHTCVHVCAHACVYMCVRKHSMLEVRSVVPSLPGLHTRDCPLSGIGPGPSASSPQAPTWPGRAGRTFAQGSGHSGCL